MDGQLDEWMDNRQMDKDMVEDGWMEGEMGRCRERRMGELINGWMDGYMDG